MTTASMLLCAAIIAGIVSPGCGGFSTPDASPTTTFGRRGAAAAATKDPPPLRMGGLFDYVRENFFLDSRKGDFVPLGRGGGDGDGANASFGPGPLILLYAVPDTMLDDGELLDMAEDGMPSRRRERNDALAGMGGGGGGAVVVVRRVAGMTTDGTGGDDDDDDELLDLSVGEALDRAMTEKRVPPAPITAVVVSAAADPASAGRRIVGAAPHPPTPTAGRQPCPVLYFSGVTNAEMMDTYRIMANEIYAETDGAHWPACAKAVPGAMGKSLRRVISEISGDHADAMRTSTAGGVRGDGDGGEGR